MYSVKKKGYGLKIACRGHYGVGIRIMQSRNRSNSSVGLWAGSSFVHFSFYIRRGKWECNPQDFVDFVCGYVKTS